MDQRTHVQPRALSMLLIGLVVSIYRTNAHSSGSLRSIGLILSSAWSFEDQTIFSSGDSKVTKENLDLLKGPKLLVARMR